MAQRWQKKKHLKINGFTIIHLVGEVVQAVAILIIIHQVGGVDLVVATPMSIVILMAGGVDQVMVPQCTIIVAMAPIIVLLTTIITAGVERRVFGTTSGRLLVEASANDVPGGAVPCSYQQLHLKLAS